jgi:hypothetical protein
MKKILFIFLVFLYACNNEKKSLQEINKIQDAKPMNHTFVEDYNNQLKINQLSKKVLIEGDTLAFRELKYIYMVSEHSEEFLYYSTVMAEKYNYGPAYQTNYDILKAFKQSTMQKLALFNLIKSYELGNKHDLQKLEEIFPKGIPKSVEYWESIDDSVVNIP